VSAAGLVPLMALAGRAGLRELADERLSVPTDKGANAVLKLSSLVAGMAAGADSIDDMALLRHGGMGKVFTGAYAPSTLGSFLRSFAFGHVRQADAVASRFLLNLAEQTELLGGRQDAGTVIVDIDDTIVAGRRRGGTAAAGRTRGTGGCGRASTATRCAQPSRSGAGRWGSCSTPASRLPATGRGVRRW